MSRAPSTEQEALVRKRLIGLAIVVLIGVGGVWYLLSRGSDVISGDILAQARIPSALAVLPDGTIRYAERVTGEIRDVSLEGEVSEQPVADIDVSIGAQRGLLGVAVDGEGRTFAAWTDPDGLLVVGQVAPGDQRIIWEGPVASELNLGGHLAFDEEGGLIVGIGDLQDPDAVADPSLPNGKMLLLDPEGDPDQRPTTISGGWTNPIAFDLDPNGVLWIADNGNDDAPERLTRGDLDARQYPITELPSDTVPSGLAATEDDLFVCGFESRRLLRYRIRGDQTVRRGPPLATNCSLAVAVLPDGRLTYSNEGTVFTLDPDAPPER